MMGNPIHISLILILSLFTAGNGFLVEANLMQCLSAVLGGTIIQYQLGTGLFIVSLGIGSLFYSKARRHFSSRSILAISTLCLMVISIAAPFVFHWLQENELAFQFQPYLYLPILLVGLITGLDLPTLIYLNKETKEEWVLGFDYLGMFVGCVSFPYLLIKIGVFRISNISILLGMISLLLIFFLPKDPRKNLTKQAIAKHNYFHLGICLVIAFCSLAYELILARWMIDFFENEIYAITFSIGFFLFGLALGSMSFRRSSLKKQVIMIESILIASMIISPFLIYGLSTLWIVYFQTISTPFLFQGILLTFIGWIGFWSGRELPLLLQIRGEQNEKEISVFFFTNYLGALIATLLVSLYLIPQFGILPSILIVVGINIVAFVSFCIAAKISLTPTISAMGLLALLIGWLPQKSVTFEQIFLKAQYHKLSVQQLSLASVSNFVEVSETIDEIRRVISPYQNIDLVRTEIPHTGYQHNDLQVFLNSQPQFSLATHNLYHDSFSRGAINLNKSVPKKVIVLGGGDGLLANKLTEIDGIKEITLIELDSSMIDLANNHTRISNANNKVFKSGKVKLILDDAFSWLQKNHKKFDAFFIDFPYPTNYELSRLYSIEFYRVVEKRLNPSGFVIMNAPFSFQFENKKTQDLDPARRLLSTLKSAGFKTLFPFGSIEPFLFAKKDQQAVTFNYEDDLSSLPNSSFVNLLPIEEITPFEHEDVNSIFRPKKVVTW